MADVKDQTLFHAHCTGIYFLIVETASAQEQVFDGIQFVQISAQPYQFGSAGSQVGRTMYERKFEMPTTHTFWMSKYEITQRSGSPS